MHIINQPWDGRGRRMGDYITRLLVQDEPRFEVFRACVAFAKAGGVLRLAPALQTFLDRGGHVEFVAGIDEGITTKQALELVMRYSTVAYVFNNPATTFHPKIYLFEIPRRRAVAFVGSSNLTVGGLYTNYEANVGVEFDLTVATDRQDYESLLHIFQDATDVAAGNAKRLDAAVLDALARARKVADERGRAGKPLAHKSAAVRESTLFPRIPVPPPPPIDQALVSLIPVAPPEGKARARPAVLSEFQPSEVFIMTLGTRDTRQTPGYSRDIYIPLAARDANENFWDWPAKFRKGSDATVGRYQERRVNVLIRLVGGSVEVVKGARLYYYNIKHEFRLNCGRLIEGAKSGDLLVIHKSLGGTLFEGRAYEFEATVFPREHPGYAAFEKECRNQIEGSSKRWGYM